MFCVQDAQDHGVVSAVAEEAIVCFSNFIEPGQSGDRT